MVGLIPRFSIIEYTGPRPDRNKKAFGRPPDGLIEWTVNLLTIALATQQNTTFVLVQMDETATALMDAFDERTTAAINSTGADIERDLWSRAHLKALKLAALVAVVNAQEPIVTRQIAEWALGFVNREVELMIKRFASGDVGEGQNKQEVDLKRAVGRYLEMSADQRKAYNTPKALLDQPLIPFHFLRRFLSKLSQVWKGQKRAERSDL